MLYSKSVQTVLYTKMYLFGFFFFEGRVNIVDLQQVTF